MHRALGHVRPVLRALAPAAGGAFALAVLTTSVPASSGASCPEGAAFVGGAVVTLGQGTTRPWPAHREAILAFCIDRDEVSGERFIACIAAGRCFPTRSCLAGDPWQPAPRPVACLDAIEAREVCRAFGGDLPSESQWEYAARGRMGRARGGEGPAPFGLRAMTGIASEWTRDPGASSTRETAIVKGSPDLDAPLYQRASVDVHEKRPDLGFRCVYPQAYRPSANAFP